MSTSTLWVVFRDGHAEPYWDAVADLDDSLEPAAILAALGDRGGFAFSLIGPNGHPDIETGIAEAFAIERSTRAGMH